MPSIDDLSQAISAYRRGSVSLSKFEDWFRTASRSMFGEPEEVLSACLVIEAAFSELQNGELREPEFAEELAKAIRPFPQKHPAIFSVSWRDPEAKRIEHESESTSGDRLTFRDSADLILSSPALSQRFALRL